MLAQWWSFEDMGQMEADVFCSVLKSICIKKIWSIYVAFLENMKFTGSAFEQNRVLFNPTSADVS